MTINFRARNRRAVWAALTGAAVLLGVGSPVSARPEAYLANCSLNTVTKGVSDDAAQSWVEADIRCGVAGIVVKLPLRVEAMGTGGCEQPIVHGPSLSPGTAELEVTQYCTVGADGRSDLALKAGAEVADLAETSSSGKASASVAEGSRVRTTTKAKVTVQASISGLLGHAQERNESTAFNFNDLVVASNVATAVQALTIASANQATATQEVVVE